MPFPDLRPKPELGDGWVIFDPIDREPFWNRAAGLTWPDDPAAFDARLAQLAEKPVGGPRGHC